MRTGLLLLPLAGCVGSPAEGPMDFWRNATGDPLQGRAPPPGLDSVGYPNLASVPPAPARGAASAREALQQALMEARSQSAEQRLAGLPVPPPPIGGDSTIPVSAPAAPRLAPAPRVNPAPALPLPGSAGTPGGMPADPGMAPAPPPAEMMAPPPMPRL